MIYHWSNKNKLAKDNKYLTDLYEDKLKYISKLLNQFHNESKDIKYWRIIIGPWLRYFIDIVFDRYEMLKINNEISVKNSKIIKIRHLNFRSKDFQSFFYAAQKNKWNFNIINLLKGKYQINNTEKKEEIKIKNYSLKEIFKKFFIKVINPINRKCNKNIIIIDQYIKLKPLIKFVLKSKILPYLTQPRKLKGISKWNIFIKEISYSNSSSNFEN